MMMIFSVLLLPLSELSLVVSVAAVVVLLGVRTGWVVAVGVGVGVVLVEGAPKEVMVLPEGELLPPELESTGGSLIRIPEVRSSGRVRVCAGEEPSAAAVPPLVAGEGEGGRATWTEPMSWR